MRFRLIILLFVTSQGIAQTITLKGLVRDTDGDRLPSAHVLLWPDSVIITSDSDGRFKLATSPGPKTITISFTGYRIYQHTFKVRKDTAFQISLQPHVSELQEVVVTSQKYTQQDLFESTRTGTTTLTQDDINAIPVLGGEADIIKTLQLLPGTIRGIEGSSDLFVRGGAADQNLILLDDAPIYNSSHLFGFLSVFNPDILDNVEAINGGFPAQYGGRLSSILNVNTTSSLATKTHISGDIGLIASRFYIEQPLVKDKASIWIAGRRTYIDKVMEVIWRGCSLFFL